MTTGHLDRLPKDEKNFLKNLPSFIPMESGIGIFENFMRQNSFKSIFGGARKSDEDPTVTSPRLIPQLSPIANSVVARCSKVGSSLPRTESLLRKLTSITSHLVGKGSGMILLIPTEELQHHFETELPDHVKHPSTYARNLLEFCSYQALNVVTQRPDYLSDKDFHRFTYDMMLAWEAPGIESEPLLKETTSRNYQETEDEDGWSLFYTNSINMAVQVDDKKTVGPEAFARIAPACAAVADIITVHNLFDLLTCSSGGQLHFLVYDKYLGSLDKVMKTAKHASELLLVSNIQLAEGEIVLDVDGTVPTQPVLQHIGISAWPGRLTLTNYALYFEPLGVGLYEKAVRYDLAMDLKQVIKPELTGPLGTRLFDKAVMYKSTSIAEPVYLEFPEFKGSSRREYWLEISLEILRAHRFIRKYNLKNTPQAEALGRAMLGIFRYRAVREAFHIFSSHYKTLLAFNLAENLPGGDAILETLSSRLEHLSASTLRRDVGTTSDDAKGQLTLSPVSLLALRRLGFMLPRGVDEDGESAFKVGDVFVGETNPLEMAVKQSKCDTGRAEAAQATVDQVKVEGIDTNIAVMKELLFPLGESVRRLQFLASWEDPFKSTVFLVLICFTIYRGWIKYILPCILIFLAALMLWHKYCNKGKPLEAFRIIPPPSRNAVEQLLTLQEAVSQFETLVQAGNIILLKLRALLFAALPQATNGVALLLIVMAALFAFVPLRCLITLVFLEAFTMEMPLRKDCSDRWLRRAREWWVRIPAAPVQLIKPEDNKKRK
ncbi:hypothetical protein HHK36_006538 [Tetracentron sinense]|uniref:Uncharacterized protein n=1 Tax=Tetracentron sinense TaxID=13715 RepID=A0A834ZRZ8_TETSI|nr:hypothetical protein HHK36_006538 [Tetracentron sinense]